MSEFQPLIDELYREEIRAARAMTPEQRMEVGFQMIDENLEWAAAFGVEEMKRRLAIGRAMKEHNCYGAPMPRP